MDPQLAGPLSGAHSRAEPQPTAAEFADPFYRQWRCSPGHARWHQRAFDRGAGEDYWLQQPHTHPGRVRRVQAPPSSHVQLVEARAAAAAPDAATVALASSAAQCDGITDN